MSDPTPDRFFDLGAAFQRARVLLSAVELGVFSELTRGPLAADTLAQRLGLHQRGARDFLDTLVALGLLERHHGAYVNTPETDRFLDAAKPSYIGDALEQFGTLMFPQWTALTNTLRTGSPQEVADIAGGGRWEARYRDATFQRIFPRAMTARSLSWARAMARTFPWERYRTFVDVGTAQGALPVQVALVHPHITGIGFDLPALQPAFEAYVASFGLADRLRFVPGSFLTDALPSAEVLVLAGVLHGWGDDQKRILLRRAYDALPRDGVLIVREIFIDEERRQAPALLFSLHMLLDTDAGRAFTANELRAWMADTAFRDIRFEPLVGPTAMMVGVKISEEQAGRDSRLS